MISMPFTSVFFVVILVTVKGFIVFMLCIIHASWGSLLLMAS